MEGGDHDLSIVGMLVEHLEDSIDVLIQLEANGTIPREILTKAAKKCKQKHQHCNQ